METSPTYCDFDDILFENKNKDYGAYAIRKEEGFNLMMGLTVSALLFFAGGTYFQILYSSPNSEAGIADNRVTIIACPIDCIGFSPIPPPSAISIQRSFLIEPLVPLAVPDEWIVESNNSPLLFDFPYSTDSEYSAGSQFPSVLDNNKYHQTNLQQILDDIKADQRIKKIKEPGRVVYELFVGEDGKVEQVTIKSNEVPAFSPLCTFRLRKLNFIGIKPGGEWLALPIYFDPDQETKTYTLDYL